MGTVEKLTLENMGIAFGILSLSGTGPEIHLGVIYRCFSHPRWSLNLTVYVCANNRQVTMRC